MRRIVATLALTIVPAGLACGRTPTPQMAPTPLVATPTTDSAAAARPAAQRARLRAMIDSLVAQPRFHNAFWGILIVDPAHSDTLYALNAHKLFMPASNMKIVTAAAALTQLGAGYRFRTTFAAQGTIRHGVLHGDLVVIGSGDPSISDRLQPDPLTPLRPVADSLAAHGVHRVAGRLVKAPDPYPESPFGYGWSVDDLAQTYAAGIDPLFFNEGHMSVVVTGAAHAGGPVTVRTAPLATYPVVRVRAATVASSAWGFPMIENDTATGDLIIEGAIPAGKSITLERPYRDQAAAYLSALSEALRSRGITFHPAGTHRVREAETATSLGVVIAAGGRPAPPPSLDTLFTIASPPLGVILPLMLKPSQNQIAEILFRTLGRDANGRLSAVGGEQAIATQLAAWGADSTEYVIRDGSGVSRYDYLAPATIVATLRTIARDSAFDVFYRALPIAGVDGTLASRMVGTPAAGNVHAKTGFVDKARSLSGYVTTADGSRLIFSALCNNWTVPVGDVEAVQDTIAAHLASMTLGTP